jgi:hypothetical protein
MPVFRSIKLRLLLKISSVQYWNLEYQTAAILTETWGFDAKCWLNAKHCTLFYNNLFYLINTALIKLTNAAVLYWGTFKTTPLVLSARRLCVFGHDRILSKSSRKTVLPKEVSSAGSLLKTETALLRVACCAAFVRRTSKRRKGWCWERELL